MCWVVRNVHVDFEGKLKISESIENHSIGMNFTENSVMLIMENKNIITIVNLIEKIVILIIESKEEN